jgi:allantoin racemase
MRILVINPNASAAMTEDMVRSARAVEPEAEITGATAGHGLPSLEGYGDDGDAAGAVIELIAAHEGSFDAAIVGCFGDPGLYAARELTEAPVVGIAEASFLTAMALGHRFSVLTTLERGAPPILDVIRLHGVESRCASVRSTGLTVLEAHGDADAAASALEREGRLAVELDRAEVLCLGCGGMVGLRERLQDTLGVPVIEAISAATAFAAALIRNDLRTSKVRAFKRPEPIVVS